MVRHSVSCQWSAILKLLLKVLQPLKVLRPPTNCVSTGDAAGQSSGGGVANDKSEAAKGTH